VEEKETNGNQVKKTFQRGGVAGAKRKTVTTLNYSRDVAIQQKQGSMVHHGMEGQNALTCVFQKCVPR
jgi:hypothetical protein